MATTHTLDRRRGVRRHDASLARAINKVYGQFLGNAEPAPEAVYRMQYLVAHLKDRRRADRKYDFAKMVASAERLQSARADAVRAKGA